MNCKTDLWLEKEVKCVANVKRKDVLEFRKDKRSQDTKDKIGRADYYGYY